MMNMNTNSSSENLKNLHEKFLESKYFSALSIMTPKKEWLCIDINDKDISEKCKCANNRNIFNLVVKEGNKVLGYINVKHIRQRGEIYDIDRTKIEKIEEHNVMESLSLFDLLKIMLNDTKKLNTKMMSPLYFVIQSHKGSAKPIGIISFWDLNRAPAYILSYPFLVYLEHTIIIIIENSHTNWVEHGSWLAELRKTVSEHSKKYRHFKEFLEDHKQDYSVLSKWTFPELVYFYENDPHIEKDENVVPRALLDIFVNKRKFRNIIAHSINLIVDSENLNFIGSLEDLDMIWNYGKTLFCNFIDPKVSYSTPRF